MSSENGRRVLYLKLNNALYSSMQSVILWYDTFKGSLEHLGFKLNKYEPCAVNKVIHGEKCTVCWYVDNTKIFHKDNKL